MRKLSENVKLFIAIVSIFTLTSVVVATYYVWSNIVTVHVVEYRLTLAPSEQTIIVNEVAVFTAKLTLGGTPVPDAVIRLFISTDGGNTWTDTGITATTDNAGECTLAWTATAIGDYSFKAGYEVP